MGKVVIYDRRRETVEGIDVSMIRANVDLHDLPGTTGEVAAFYPDGADSVIWAGPAAYAGDVFRYVVESFQQGADEDEILDGLIALRRASVVQ